MLIQGVRRLNESLKFQSTGKAVMWIGHYFIGMLYYIGVNIACLSTVYDPVTKYDDVARYVGILLFGIASWKQFLLHKNLAVTKARAKGEYAIPSDHAFQNFIAPHYTCEIIIYASLCIISQFQNQVMVSVLVWTIIILSISASESRTWALKKWSGKWSPRWNVLPFW